MKKMPCLFEREFISKDKALIKTTITPGCERAFLEGTPTVKWDGTSTYFKDGILYKRYDAKKREPPAGSIPCEPNRDPITGHWPHWTPVSETDPADKWHRLALEKRLALERLPGTLTDGKTYELCGPHFQSNPQKLDGDTFLVHGGRPLYGVPRDFMGLRAFINIMPYEGIVFWLDGEPVCKIRRKDFGFDWPMFR